MDFETVMGWAVIGWAVIGTTVITLSLIVSSCGRESDRKDHETFQICIKAGHSPEACNNAISGKDQSPGLRGI